MNLSHKCHACHLLFTKCSEPWAILSHNIRFEPWAMPCKIPIRPFFFVVTAPQAGESIHAGETGTDDKILRPSPPSLEPSWATTSDLSHGRCPVKYPSDFFLVVTAPQAGESIHAGETGTDDKILRPSPPSLEPSWATTSDLSHGRCPVKYPSDPFSLLLQRPKPGSQFMQVKPGQMIKSWGPHRQRW